METGYITEVKSDVFHTDDKYWGNGRGPRGGEGGSGLGMLCNVDLLYKYTHAHL